MHLNCPSCDHQMNDDDHCLVGMPRDEDDAHLCDYFADYRLELWKCPECGYHHVIVERAGQQLFAHGLTRMKPF